MVTVLYLHAGEPDVAGLTNPFSDVNEEADYYYALKWAADNGIVNGVGGGRYAPDSSITREQLAAIFYRYAEFIGFELPQIRTGAFTDESLISSYASDAVRAMFEAGIINGKGGGVFDPGGNATRAEVATMLMRFIEIVGGAELDTGTVPLAATATASSDAYIDRSAQEALTAALTKIEDDNEDLTDSLPESVRM